MKRTHFLTAAYHESMDTAYLMLLLALIGGNEEMKSSLRSFLCVYRENRELIQALLGQCAPPPCPPPPCAPPPPHKECRPHGGIGTLDILDEYLRRV